MQMKEVSIPSVNSLPEYARKMAVFSLLMKFTNQQVALSDCPSCPAETGGEPKPFIGSTKLHVDWSHALLKYGSDPSQTKLTSFFHVIEKITELTNTEPKFKAVIQASEEQHRKIGLQI